MRAILISLFVILLLGCAPEVASPPEQILEPPEPAPVLPEELVPDTPEQTEPIEEVEEIAASDDGSVRVLACSLEERSLTFEVTNTHDVAWDFSNQLPFVPPKGIIPAWIYLNNYKINRPSPIFDPQTKEQYFGLGETLAENCGTDRLEPGDSMTCSFQPVPLILEDSWRVDYLELDVPYSKGFYFDCN